MNDFSTHLESILIVDNSPDNLNLLGGILSNAQYKIHLAPTGKLALKFMQSHLPDLILLDIMMPQINGYEVCNQLKASEETQDIPIIFISALHDVTDKVKAFSLGAADYITKPFQEQEVLVRVENQLRLRRLSKQLIAQNILQERDRMAREIHDTLAQTFTGIIVHLRAAERAMATAPEQMLTHIQTVRKLAGEGLAEARRSVVALRPRLLEEGDLYSALNEIATQMSLHTEVSTIVTVTGTAYPLLLEAENNLLRIGQEALTNALKYANSNSIHVELIYEAAQFTLRVQDNGQGFDVESLNVKQGFGFLSMRERAARIGAKLVINSQLQRGTEVIVSINR